MKVRNIYFTGATIAIMAGCSIPEFTYPPGPPSIIEWSATPFELLPGETYELRWQVEGASSVEIEPSDGTPSSVDSAGTQTFEAATPLTWTLRATGPGGTRTAVLDVQTLSGPQVSIRRFEARPARFRPGDPVRILWETENAERVVLSDVLGSELFRSNEPTGSIVLRPVDALRLRLLALGRPVPQEAEIDVELQSDPPLVFRFEAQPPIASLTTSTRLVWQVTNATRLSIIGLTVGFLAEIADPDDMGSVEIEGPLPVGVHRFRMRVENEVGVAENFAQLVWLAEEGAAINRFDVAPTTTGPGGQVRAAWSIRGVEEARLWRDDTLVVADGPPSATVVVRIDETSTLRLVADDPLGNRLEAETSVAVDPTFPRWIQADARPSIISPGMTSTISYEVANAEQVIIERSDGRPPLVYTASTAAVPVNPTADTTYTLRAIQGGRESLRFVDVKASASPLVNRFDVPDVIRARQRFLVEWQTENVALASIIWRDQRTLIPPDAGSIWLEADSNIGQTIVRLEVENGAQTVTVPALIDVLPQSEGSEEAEPNDTPWLANSPFALFDARVSGALSGRDRDTFLIVPPGETRFEGAFIDTDCSGGLRVDVYRDDGRGGWLAPTTIFDDVFCPEFGRIDTPILADIEPPFLLALASTDTATQPYDLQLSSVTRECGDGTLDWTEDCDDAGSVGCDPACFAAGTDELEPNRNRTTSTDIDPSLPVQGYMRPNDRDWFRFSISPDQAGPWSIRIDAPCSVYVVLGLYDETGRQLALARPDDPTGCPSLDGPRLVLEAGTYHVRVEGTRQPPTRGRYVLRLDGP